MDIRKLGAAAIGGAALVLAVAFSVGQRSGEDAVGSYRGGFYQSPGSSFAGGLAPTDTIRIRSRSIKFPNSAAITAGYSISDSTFYDVDNKSDAGTAIKYAMIQLGAPDATYHTNADAGFNRLYGLRVGDLTEQTFEWVAGSQRLCFVWVSANGLSRGQKVLNAHLMVNAGTGGVDLATTGNFLTVRLDTLANDYGILTGTAVGGAYGTANDYNMFAATWNQMDTDANTNWTPALSSRDDVLDGVVSGDWHDFGPRSATTFGGTYTAGTCFRFDVSDAIQQRLDDPAFDPAKGFLFVIQVYGGTLLAPTFNAGNHPIVGAGSGKGLPVFTATVSTKRGQKAWNGAKVPVVLTFDDNKSDHTLYMPIVRAAGLRFCNINQTGAFDASPATTYGGEATTRYDSLMAANAGFVDIVHHSKTHPAFGSLTGAGNFHLELEKYSNYPTWIVPPDTSAIAGFAHPGGTAPRYSFEGIGAIMRHGYTSARTNERKSGVAPNETPIGWVDYLAWDRPANVFTVTVYPASLIACSSGTTTRTSKASVREAFYDAANSLYMLQKSAMVLYAHSRLADGLTAQALQWIVEIAQESNCLLLMDYYEVIDIRRRGSDFITPAAAEAWFDAAGYNAAVYGDNAARWDTLAIYDADFQNRVWLESK